MTQAERQGRSMSASGNLSILNIRSFRKEDGPAVRTVFRRHWRSLSPASVRYYVTEHFQDLLAFLAVCKLFISWKQLAIVLLIYLAYIFIRAVLEMEYYIYRGCPDLTDIWGTYMTSRDDRSHFWVAEATSTNNGKTKGADEKELSVVGCVGLIPYRNQPQVAQLVRLVVEQSQRRMRIGSRLLAQFENYANEHGFSEVRLYTNNLNTSHMKFIRQHNYEVQQIIKRGLMRGDLIQWRKLLFAGNPRGLKKAPIVMD